MWSRLARRRARRSPPPTPCQRHRLWPGHRRASQRRVARSRVPARRRRHRRPGGHRERRWQVHPAALDRARHGAGRAGPIPAGEAGDRAADRERVLLRLRRGPAVHPGGPEGDRGPDAPDRAAGPALLPPGRDRRAGPGGTRRRAVQARADRAQGARVRLGCVRIGRVGRGRGDRADHLRQPGPGQRRAVLEGPVPRSAPADHEADPGVQADAQRRSLLAGEREERAAAADLRHRLGDPRQAG